MKFKEFYNLNEKYMFSMEGYMHDRVYAVYKNPTTNDIDDIHKAAKETDNFTEVYGIRYGVVENDLYAWDSEVTHCEVEQELGIHRFDFSFYYDKLLNRIGSDLNEKKKTWERIPNVIKERLKILHPTAEIGFKND